MDGLLCPVDGMLCSRDALQFPQPPVDGLQSPQDSFAIACARNMMACRVRWVRASRRPDSSDIGSPGRKTCSGKRSTWLVAMPRKT